MIVIFDLDNTICNYTLNSQEKINYIKNMIKYYKVTYDAKFYVITARRLENFNGSTLNLLTYNIPNDIINLLLELNKKRNDRWLFYNINDTDPEYSTTNLLNLFNKHSHFNHFLQSKQLNRDYLYHGIKKSLQIDEILSKYPQGIPVLFFDDASHNRHALEFYTTFIKPMKNITMYGGQDKPVFFSS